MLSVNPPDGNTSQHSAPSAAASVGAITIDAGWLSMVVIWKHSSVMRDGTAADVVVGILEDGGMIKVVGGTDRVVCAMTDDKEPSIKNNIAVVA